MDNLNDMKILCMTIIIIAGGLLKKHAITYYQYKEMVKNKVEFLQENGTINMNIWYIMLNNITKPFTY